MLDPITDAADPADTLRKHFYLCRKSHPLCHYKTRKTVHTFSEQWSRRPHRFPGRLFPRYLVCVAVQWAKRYDQVRPPFLRFRSISIDTHPFSATNPRYLYISVPNYSGFPPLVSIALFPYFFHDCLVFSCMVCRIPKNGIV